MLCGCVFCLQDLLRCVSDHYAVTSLGGQAGKEQCRVVFSQGLLGKSEAEVKIAPEACLASSSRYFGLL